MVHNNSDNSKPLQMQQQRVNDLVLMHNIVGF
jgi:hypothetical protein